MLSTPASDETLQLAIVDNLAEIILDSSGIEIDITNPNHSFLEIGLDSLFLTQLVATINNKFNVKVVFRQMLNELSSPALLADYIAINADQSQLPVVKPQASITPDMPLTSTNPIIEQIPSPETVSAPAYPKDSLQAILNQQLQIMERQLAIITGQPMNRPSVITTSNKQECAANPSPSNIETITAQKPPAKKEKSFGPAAKISIETDDSLTDAQNKFIQNLATTYTNKTRKSKEFAAKNRKHLADPRTVSGFRPLFKEMIYQIVVEKSSGCKLTDIDGNEYVDMLNGFGSNFLGYSPEFVTNAVYEQMKCGIEIGPQHPLTETVAELMAEFTGLERFAFCNTGSEAVLGSMRIARTVTGRKTIVIFNGAYHGIFDEVIARGTPSLKSFAAAPGINNEAVSNIIVLEYDNDESLKIIKEHSQDIAAILVEPVQSRNPALQPQKFLHQLRKIATESGSALIIDEVITGFRIHPGGSQAYFGVEADLATYGKVIGGGLPIGIIGGKKRFMDALDGGQWQYGDDSFPEIGVTYFAGTFVRHPMALAACKAVLEQLKKQGGDLQKSLNQAADIFCEKLNALFKTLNAQIRIDHFGSLMKIQFEQESPFNELLYFLLRKKGVHVWDARPSFLTTTHTQKDLDFIHMAFDESITLLQSVGFMNGKTTTIDNETVFDKPPVPGARLGKTPTGEPAWFISDPDRPGKFCQLTQ